MNPIYDFDISKCLVCGVFVSFDYWRKDHITTHEEAMNMVALSGEFCMFIDGGIESFNRLYIAGMT